MQDLGTFGGNTSEAYGVSADGTVVVGWARNSIGQNRAFRWDSAGMQALSNLSGASGSIAYGVSADGSVIVGIVAFDEDSRAVRWVNGQIEDLNQVYASLLESGSELWTAVDVSPDGRFIVGTGYNARTRRMEGYLLDTAVCTRHYGDVNEDGCVDDADLLSVLFAFGSSGTHLGRVDVNCDGVVDDADILIVLFNFGNRC